MALTFWRWGSRNRIYPADPRSYEAADLRRPLTRADQPPDDYILETEAEASRPPVALQAVRVLQFILIVVIALLSLAVFWMIGLILGFL